MKTQSVRLPAWLSSRAGILETVPEPWPPVRVHRDIFSCWGREHVFAGHPFPGQVVSRGAGLLARPVELACTINGREQIWKKCDVKRVERHPRGRWAEREAVGLMGQLLLTSRTTLFYEGALKIDVTVAPLAPMTVDSLSIRIPMRREQAGLMAFMFSPVAALKDLPPDGVKGPFSPPLAWIGTEERGLTWFCESDEGWDSGADALEARPAGNAVELHVRSHHAFWIRVNGAEVFKYGGAGVPRYGQRSFSREENVIKVILHPGWNPVLIKMLARSACTLQLKITGPNNSTVPPLDIRAQDAP